MSSCVFITHLHAAEGRRCTAGPSVRLAFDLCLVLPLSLGLCLSFKHWHSPLLSCPSGSVVFNGFIVCDGLCVWRQRSRAGLREEDEQPDGSVKRNINWMFFWLETKISARVRKREWSSFEIESAKVVDDILKNHMWNTRMRSFWKKVFKWIQQKRLHINCKINFY